MSKSKEVDGFLVSFEAKGEVSAIPVPPKPDYSDDSETDYVPNSLTDEEKNILSKAATLYTRTLSLPFIPDSLKKAANVYEASTNITHYVNGNGSTKEYDEEQTESLISQGVLYGKNTDVVVVPIKQPDGTTVLGPKKIQESNSETILEAFLQLVKEDFKGKNKQGYLSLNLERTIYMNWFTAESSTKKWHFAIGSFMIAYGAYLHRIGEKKVLLKYRSYIFDRYNWDKDKSVEIPVVAKMMAFQSLSKEEQESFDILNSRLELIKKGSASVDVITDRFMGILSELGTIEGQKAHAFDILGGSKILGYEYEEE